jgi:hypothetical protein
VAIPITEIVNDLRPTHRYARILYRGAAFWMVSAAVHLGALALDGWQWSGAVSFRKPLVFSLSVGLLMATMGWVLDRLPRRPRLSGALAWTFLVSSSIEVGLISLQTWRGRASHFNVVEAGDAAIFAMMGASVGVMSLCLIGLLIWSAIERPANRQVRLAVIGGLALVATGLGIGQWIIELGNAYVAANQTVPDTVIYGEEGVAKFPHAIAFHGIQVFILGAVLLSHGHFDEATRQWLMRLVFWSYTVMLVFAAGQTIAGRAPTGVSWWSFGLVISVGGVVYGLARIITGARTDREVSVPVA